MDARALATLLAIVTAVAGAVALTAPARRANPGAHATAAALEAHMAWLFEDPEGRSHASDSKLPRVALCIATEAPLDFAALSKALEGSRLRPVPASQCTSQSGYDTANSWAVWFDDSGVQAKALTVLSLACPTASRCLVDINSDIDGRSYEVRRMAEGWAVTTDTLRWIS